MPKYIVIAGSIPSLRKRKVIAIEGSNVKYAKQVPGVNDLGLPCIADQPGAREIRMGDVVDEEFFPDGVESQSCTYLLQNKFIEKYVPHTLTKEDLKKNPKLVEFGAHTEGDEIHANKKGFVKAEVKSKAEPPTAAATT